MEIKQTEPAQILACLKEIFASQQLSAIQLAEAATQSISLGAYLAGELVGGIVIKRNYQTAHVSQLAVKPTYQRLGVGRQLLQAGEKQAKERGAKTITLTTRSYQAPLSIKNRDIPVLANWSMSRWWGSPSIISLNVSIEKLEFC